MSETRAGTIGDTAAQLPPSALQSSALQSSALQSSNDVVFLVRWMWKRRLPLFLAAAIGAVLGVAMSFLSTPIYRAEAVVAFAGEDQSGALGRAGGDLSSIASLVGVNVGGGGEDNEELLALLQSRVLGGQFIQQERMEQTLLDAPHLRSALSGVIGSPVPADRKARSAYRVFAKVVRVVELDRKTGLVRVAMQWPNPRVAADWTNRYIALADDNFRRQRLARHRARSKALQAQLNVASTAEVRLAAARLMEGELKVIMSASTRGDFALRVVDPAVAPLPNERVSPSRPLYLLVGVLLGVSLMLTVLWWRRDSRADAAA